MKRTAVVILNWNGKNYLHQFLPQIIGSVRNIANVVVADNGSTDGSVEMLKTEFPEATLIAFNENYGFAEGYNRALNWVRNTLKSEVYVLLNSDVEVTPNWLLPLLQRLENTSEACVVMPKIRAYHNRNHFEYAGAAGGFLDILGYPYCRGRLLNHVERDIGQYDHACQVHWASGACLAIKATSFWEAGGLPRIFFAHMEEIDLCWRIRRLGGEIWVEPNSLVYHIGGGSLPNNSPQKLYLNFRNSIWMLRRNLPRSRIWLLIVRAFCDCAAWTIYLAKGEKRNAHAVYRAYREAFKKSGDLRFTPFPHEHRAPLSKRSIIWDFYIRGRRT